MKGKGELIQERKDAGTRKENLQTTESVVNEVRDEKLVGSLSLFLSFLTLYFLPS